MAALLLRVHGACADYRPRTATSSPTSQPACAASSPRACWSATAAASSGRRAYGVHESGYREVIALDVGEAETEAFWRSFLRSLVERSLTGVELVVSDAHAGRSSTESSDVKGAAMNENQIHGRIEALVFEEHPLWEREAAGEATDADRGRLDSLKVTVGQYWDLLRQRRALREARLDPETARARDPDVVEHYEQ